MLESSPQTPTVPLHVLLAEDNLLNQRITQLMVTKRGHRVDIVGDGYDVGAGGGKPRGAPTG